MGFNSTWKRRCPLILRIKGGSLLSGSASVLLSEGSEASHLCRERNWIRSLFQLLGDFNSHARAKAGVTLQSAGVVVSLSPSPAINFYRGYRNEFIKGEALYYFAWHFGGGIWVLYFFLAVVVERFCYGGREKQGMKLFMYC
ncbi:hypothetical protein RchiOBHm_Chr4g0409531 [Rosa chinensis]|uniref:Uncharacterized protein n=1 Tax=Rosa chinensis TaxID=74649 RepID=A0A2P6QV36_ROSCH|nr:uncharacterized protein LOC112198484 [Rosa chinensis]PRQ38052.1 hypothetical protein RchiOBHm_Chr4g0409531 [Rosa chinensis]